MGRLPLDANQKSERDKRKREARRTSTCNKRRATREPLSNTRIQGTSKSRGSRGSEHNSEEHQAIECSNHTNSYGNSEGAERQNMTRRGKRAKSTKNFHFWLGDMTVETLEQKLRGDDDTWKDCITQDPSAAVLMFYLNSGMFRFDEFKDFFDKSPSPDEAPALRTSISGWAT